MWQNLTIALLVMLLVALVLYTVDAERGRKHALRQAFKRGLDVALYEQDRALRTGQPVPLSDALAHREFPE